MPVMSASPVDVDEVHPRSRSAVIIGAGVGALAAGIALRQAGWEVGIYERDAALRTKGGALMLWPNATRALSRLGVLDAVAAGASEIHTAQIRHVQGPRFNRLPVRHLATKFGAPCLVVKRSHLLQVLADQLPVNSLHFSRAAAEVDAKHATAVFEDGSSVGGNVVIGADGVHSAVRRCLLNDGPPASVRQWAFVGMSRRTDALVDLAAAGTTVGTVATGLRFWYAVLPDDWIYWYAVVSDKRRREEGLHDRADLSRLLAPWGQPTSALIETAEEWTVVEIHHRTPIGSWHRGRVALLGDAAQPMSPDLGQGAGMALEQAVVLGRVLAPRGRVDAALGRYSARCIPRTASVASASRIVAETSMPDDARLASMRDRIWMGTPDSAAMLHLEMLIAPGCEAPGV